MAKRNLQFGGHVPMDPGERDKKVTIEQTTESAGSSSFPVDTWTTLAADVWMSRHDMKGSERFGAGQLSAAGDTRWEMGYRADMDPDLVDVPKVRRLNHQGRIYDIVAASMIGRKAGVEVLTLAKVG